MNVISTLWENEKLPIKDGLYYADGRSFSIELKIGDHQNLELGKAFNLESFYENDTEWVTSIDVIKEGLLFDEGYFCCGEGSHGSEGFFACLNLQRKLRWVVYFEWSNPFFDFSFRENIAIVKSTSGLVINVNLNNPELFSVDNTQTNSAAFLAYSNKTQ